MSMYEPVNEQLRVAARNAAQPGKATPHMTSKAPVLSPPPVRQFSVDLKEDSIHGAPVEAPVVIPPATEYWIIPGGKFLNGGA